jgi:hypothetical protein
MEEPDSGYTIDQHLAPPGAAAHELASAGHRRILVHLSSRDAQPRQFKAHMRRSRNRPQPCGARTSY